MQIPIFTAIASSLLTGLIGLLVGNWLAIGRDRRKEFNSLTEPIQILLLQEKEKPNPNSNSPDKVNFTLFRERLPFWKRRTFDQILQNYNKSKNEQNRKCDAMGQVFYKDQTLVIHSIEALLRIIKTR